MSLSCTFFHSQNCNSECASSHHLHFPHVHTKLPLSYLVSHVLVVDCGYSSLRPSDPFLPAWDSFAPSLSCTSSAICAITLPSRFNPPPFPWSLSRHSHFFSHLSSPACPFFGWPLLLIVPDQQQGAKKQRRNSLKKNTLVSLRLAQNDWKQYLKHKAVKIHENQTDLA